MLSGLRYGFGKFKCLQPDSTQSKERGFSLWKGRTTHNNKLRSNTNQSEDYPNKSSSTYLSQLQRLLADIGKARKNANWLELEHQLQQLLKLLPVCPLTKKKPPMNNVYRQHLLECWTQLLPLLQQHTRESGSVKEVQYLARRGLRSIIDSRIFDLPKDISSLNPTSIHYSTLLRYQELLEQTFMIWIIENQKLINGPVSTQTHSEFHFGVFVLMMVFVRVPQVQTLVLRSLTEALDKCPWNLPVRHPVSFRSCFADKFLDHQDSNYSNNQEEEPLLSNQEEELLQNNQETPLLNNQNEPLLTNSYRETHTSVFNWHVLNRMHGAPLNPEVDDEHNHSTVDSIQTYIQNLLQSSSSALVLLEFFRQYCDHVSSIVSSRKQQRIEWKHVPGYAILLQCTMHFITETTAHQDKDLEFDPRKRNDGEAEEQAQVRHLKEQRRTVFPAVKPNQRAIFYYLVSKCHQANLELLEWTIEALVLGLNASSVSAVEFALENISQWIQQSQHLNPSNQESESPEFQALVFGIRQLFTSDRFEILTRLLRWCYSCLDLLPREVSYRLLSSCFHSQLHRLFFHWHVDVRVLFQACLVFHGGSVPHRGLAFFTRERGGRTSANDDEYDDLSCFSDQLFLSSTCLDLLRHWWMNSSVRTTNDRGDKKRLKLVQRWEADLWLFLQRHQSRARTSNLDAYLHTGLASYGALVAQYYDTLLRQVRRDMTDDIQWPDFGSFGLEDRPALEDLATPRSGPK